MYTSILEEFITLLLTGIPSGNIRWSPTIIEQLQQEFQQRKKDESELDIKAHNIKTTIKETPMYTTVTCTADYIWGFHYQGAFWGVPGVEETKHARTITEYDGQFIFTIDTNTHTVVFVQETIAGNSYGRRPKRKGIFRTLFG